MAATWSARPSSSAGYWRGGMSDGPLWKGQGSFAYGPAAQGVGMLPPGSGSGGSSWSPTVTYLLIFVVVEIVAVRCLERWLK